MGLLTLLYSQQEIKEEVKRTFQKINALQPNLTTSKSDIHNFLNKDGDTTPLEDLNRRKDKIPQHDWNNCNKKQLNLTTSQNNINNFLNKDGDTAPLEELNRRKNKIPQHDWNNCNKNSLKRRNWMMPYSTI